MSDRHENDSAEWLGDLGGSCSIFRCHDIAEVTLRHRNWQGILATAKRIGSPSSLKFVGRYSVPLLFMVTPRAQQQCQDMQPHVNTKMEDRER